MKKATIDDLSMDDLKSEINYCLTDSRCEEADLIDLFQFIEKRNIHIKIVSEEGFIFSYKHSDGEKLIQFWFKIETRLNTLFEQKIVNLVEIYNFLRYTAGIDLNK